MNRVKPEDTLTGGLSGAMFLLANIFCWAAVPVLLRYLTGTLDAWTANGFRYPLAALLYWPILFVGWRTGNLNPQTFRRCIVPSFFAFGGQVLWALAPYYLPASAIGFFMRFSLVFALVGAMALFPDERRLLSLPAFYGGLILLAGGFVFMSLSKVQLDAEVTTAGIGIILLCGVFFGFYGVSVRFFLRGVHPLIGFGIVSHYVSVGTLVAMFAFGNYSQLLDVSTTDWGIIVASSVLGIALGHYFLYSAVSRLGAAVTSGAQTLTPFPTMLLAGWLLHERLTGFEWCAGLTMVAGAAMLLYAQHRLVTVSQQPTARQQPGSGNSKPTIAPSEPNLTRTET